MRRHTAAIAVFCVMFQVIVIRTASGQKWVGEWLSGMELAAGLGVLLISFGVTATTVYLADLAVDEADVQQGQHGEVKRDVEAYMDQMLAANGTPLHRDI